MQKGMQVQGEIYPPTPMNVMLSQICMYVLFTMIALTFIGESLFKTVDFPLGLKVCNFLKTNFSATMILAFILNTMAQQLVATGAFEIVINDETVFSKLETGRLPTMELLDDLAKTYVDSATS
uniref:Selenoprotein T n=1 Tax=Lotharella oceanica TaxID=641309 RepID=A0A7S2TFZ1_9EUKA|mmetsp:Transcript_10429/g.19971  ORF Transcript_10429/g.19971 Transcript_10429/m.19971 type:complete len:123 (+) Transcript_10429:102-470(+)